MTHEAPEIYMRQCLALAQTALQSGNPPVGALIVLDDQVIGTGIESGRSSGDITRHAEILAVRDAIHNGYRDQLHRSIMYTTHEPCIMCSYLLRHHRIPELIYGAPVPDIGGHTSKFDILNTEEIPKWGKHPDITGGILRGECEALTSRFITLLKDSKP